MRLLLRFVRTVLASVPLCDVTEEDLTQNPQFCKLLATLSQHVDRTGLTVPLKTELDKVPTDSTHNETAFSHAVLNNCLHTIPMKSMQRTFLFPIKISVRFCVVYRLSRSCRATDASACNLRASTSVCRRCYKITASESTTRPPPLTKTWYIPPYLFAKTADCGSRTICAI